MMIRTIDGEIEKLYLALSHPTPQSTHLLLVFYDDIIEIFAYQAHQESMAIEEVRELFTHDPIVAIRSVHVTSGIDLDPSHKGA